ncbi:unnamed protein product [Albugo candida]|nr:unnamed protein product [Albugo candida]|eukprot:CCI47569.1 unnamed protein product [Albugo candida]
MKKLVILRLRKRFYMNESADYLASVRLEIQALAELKSTLEARVHNAAGSKGVRHELIISPDKSALDKKEPDCNAYEQHNQTRPFEPNSCHPEKRNDPIIRRITFEDEDDGWSSMKMRYAQ